MNYDNGKEIPTGFGMALAQNSMAMSRFSNLSEPEKQVLIDGTHSISSKQEMRAYVDKIVQG